MQQPRYGLREITGLPRTEIFAFFLRPFRLNCIQAKQLTLLLTRVIVSVKVPL